MVQSKQNIHAPWRAINKTTISCFSMNYKYEFDQIIIQIKTHKGFTVYVYFLANMNVDFYLSLN